MDLFEILGLIGVVSLWVAIGCVPWFIRLVRSNRNGVQWRILPLASCGAAGAALLVPLLRKDTLGFGLSLIVALATSAAVIVAAAVMTRAEVVQ